MATKSSTTKKVVITGAVLLLLGLGIYLYLHSRPKTDPTKTLQDVFENLVFETNKDIIKPESNSYLDKLVEVLLAEPKWKLQIVGHTDNVGKDAFNLDLSKRRANAVKIYLISKSVPEASITTDGKGETTPIATNDTEEGRAKNRRVEFIIVKPKNGIVDATK
jgi:outer membrane protein OmpA-like peptidoglycan-associated protein